MESRPNDSSKAFTRFKFEKLFELLNISFELFFNVWKALIEMVDIKSFYNIKILRKLLSVEDLQKYPVILLITFNILK